MMNETEIFDKYLTATLIFEISALREISYVRRPVKMDLTAQTHSFQNRGIVASHR